MYRTSSQYGWKPDLPDHRDFQYIPLAATLDGLPSMIDLRAYCPPVYTQGQLGSCTGNAIAGAFQFELLKQNSTDFVPSRLFIYYNERVIENTVDTDNGAQIRDGIKSIANLGVCDETMWPYIISEFTKKPFATCYADALKHTAIQYQSIAQDVDQMKSCLAEGYPFIIGFTVYNSFESHQVALSGILNIPAADEYVVGGHAAVVVGYDDSQSRFIVRNSWGAGWGMAGYFTMPYDYLTNNNLSRDFWTLRLVATNAEAQTPVNGGGVPGILPVLIPDANGTPK